MKMTRAVCLLVSLLVAASWPGLRARAGTLVQFETPVGNLVVELYDADKPVTTSNFLSYINSGLYQNSFIHRLIPGFVVQGGGYSVANRFTSNAVIASIPTYPPIPSEFNSGKRYSNTFGAIAMALEGTNVNSGNSQFFINLADNSSTLDVTNASGGPFTVFGHVIAGTNVLNTFNLFSGASPTDTILNLSQYFDSNFTDWPFLSTNATFNDLIYTGISSFELPWLQVTPPAAGAVQLAWNNSTNLAYHVDVTTNLPAVWHELAVVTGTTTNFSYLSTNKLGGTAFYRLRLQY